MMTLRPPLPSEALIIKSVLRHLYNAMQEKGDTRDSRNMIYARAAESCGVSYERVVNVFHKQLYFETAPGVVVNAWKGGLI